MTKIVQFTTVHPRYDVRIASKESVALAEWHSGPVRLLVQDGNGDESRLDGRLEVIDTGPKISNRFQRMTLGGWRMFRAVRRERPRVAHFHDPELIPTGILLKLSGIRVVYDVHEDVPRQVLGKQWIPAAFRRPISWFAALTERTASLFFDRIVAATPVIARRFPSHKTVTVQNFPSLSEAAVADALGDGGRGRYFVYAGALTSNRGSGEIVEAIGRISDPTVHLEILGKFAVRSDEESARTRNGWERVDFHGWVDRPAVSRILGSACAGLVVFHPSQAHLDAQPNKMFEYMASELPVIASDFPLWSDIVDGAACGLLVDPLDPDSIAEAMQWILDNPSEAEAMGRRGRQAVVERYNWETEKNRLTGMYQALLAS